MRFSVLALALSMLGCASLQGDGYYACARGGHCPSSAPMCGRDGLCHASGVDASSPMDAGSPDMGVAPLTYPACNGDTPATCGTDTCYFDPVLGDTHDGYCTRHCATDADCPAYQGATSACVAGQCARGSRAESDCPDALASASGRWEDGVMLRLCVSLVAAEANWYDTCELDGDCERPLSCIGGYCLRACATGADCVPNLEHCITSAGGPRACLFQCTTASECNFLSGQCDGSGCHPHPGW